MKITQNQFFGYDADKAVKANPGSIYITIDTKRIYIYDRNGLPKLTNSNALSGANVVVDFFADLPMDLDPDSIAFVLYPTGTKWLPGSLGGTYYPAGWYIFRGGLWESNDKLVNEQLKIYGDLISANTNSIDGHVADLNNPHSVTKAQVGLGSVDNTSDLDKPVSTSTTLALSNKADTVHTHTKSQITDFLETDYATGAEGDLAVTALQPGDNISELINDEVYLQPGDNVSAFVNDANYVSTATVASYRSDIDSPTDVIYSGYLVDTVPKIKKYDDGIVTFAVGVTDLETDWTNRLSLTYA